jgi:STE24 endopeptidase
VSTSTTSARPTPALPLTDQPVGNDRLNQGPSLAESLTLGAALALCLLAKLAHRLAAAVGARGWIPTLVVAVAVVSIARAVARAPFTLRRSLRLPRNDTSAAAGLRGWALGEAGMAGATFVVGIVVAAPLYLLVRATPRWWLFAWFISAAVTVAWQAAMPALLATRAGSLVPASGPLAARLHALARQAGVDLPGGVVVAAKARNRCANAYVVGLGPTRRVVLEQAVVSWPPELVDQAVAHELGHVRLGHAGRRLPLAVLAQLATLAAAAALVSLGPVLRLAGIGSIADPAGYPLLLALGAVVVLPARCLLAWHARAQERAADSFALSLLERPDEFTAMLRRASADSGAPSSLPWWRHLTASHPPVDERVAGSRNFVPAGFQPTGA